MDKRARGKKNHLWESEICFRLDDVNSQFIFIQTSERKHLEHYFFFTPYSKNWIKRPPLGFMRISDTANN